MSSSNDVTKNKPEVSIWRSGRTTDLVASVIVLAFVALSVVVMSTAKRTERPLAVPQLPQSLEGAAINGSMDASVGILEFTDFQCPFCARFARSILPELDHSYIRNGTLLLAVRQAPLLIHQFARTAAEIAKCAQREGKFWDFHNRLFGVQSPLDLQQILSAGEVLGLDRSRLEECRSTIGAALVDHDLASMKQLRVTGTPSFFIGRILPDHRLQVTATIQGSPSLPVFREAIEKAWKK